MKGWVTVAFVMIGFCESAIWDKLDNTGDAIWDKFNEKMPDFVNPMNLLYTNSCIEDLGCFYTGPPFYHPIHRPISLPPTTRVDDIKFRLYTPSNKNESYELDITLESLLDSDFDPKLETKFVIHGFLTQLFEWDKIFLVKDALLKTGDFNVIVVDWTAINYPFYAQAVANTRVVGAKIAKLIHFLMNKTSQTPNDFHIIGHSLGGQTAGYAGKRIPGLKRITGLDPAGPYFYEDAPAVRLDRSDALFVDVIHTDGGEKIFNGLGVTDPSGHVDFYPNGGRLQAGCTITSKERNVVGVALNFTVQWFTSTCDHIRAMTLFAETITNTDCKFLAVQCSSYLDYEHGMCPPGSTIVNRMGYYAKKIPGVEPPAKFYLRTNLEPPYCNDESIYI